MDKIEFMIKAIIITLLVNISILVLGGVFINNAQIQLKDVKTNYTYTIISGVIK